MADTARIATATLTAAPSPHLHGRGHYRTIMRDVGIALLPTAAGSVYIFGMAVVPYYLISVGTAVVLDWIWRTVRHGGRKFDYTPVVTGMLLAMSLPATAPYWFAVAGAFVGIIVAKEAFGGVGRNFLNPAVTGRLALRLLFVGEMTRNIWPRASFAVPERIDALSGATPLMLLKHGETLEKPELLASLLGITGGKIGKTSALLLLIGATWLLYRRVITVRIPLVLLGTIACIAWLSGGGGAALGHVLGGAGILAAFFMATDYASSPSTPQGQWIFAIGIGIITMLIRFFGSYSEGMTFAIVIMNFSVPLLNRITRPRVLGEK